ncbi:MAG: benzoyl-CoA reductase subunit C [Planctomycetes bacterium]|nr:benzoyl-CoA reductase subunit C [Planctomycetota bacterium]
MTATNPGTELQALVSRAEDLAHDVTLRAVREWKAAEPSRKAIGYMPVYVPREIIHAAGMLPVGVFGAGESVEIVKGDAFFQSYICHIPRSVLDLALRGALDCLDGMLFPSTCDVIRNLSGMWQMLFPQKYVHYIDLPQDPSPGLGGAFFAREMRQIADDLGRMGGTPVTDGRLRASIAAYNENRRLVEELYQLRRSQFWLAPASEVYVLLRAGNVLPVEEHTKLLAEYLTLARQSGRHPVDMARVAIRGCFCEQPPVDLIRTLERAGCTIVDDDWLIHSRWPRGSVDAQGDPFEALSSAFLYRSPSCPSLYRAHERKGASLVADAREARAEGVIFASASFCDPALLDQPMTMAAVKQAEIPCTAFLYAENTGQFQPIREQAGTFADAIKLS